MHFSCLFYAHQRAFTLFELCITLFIVSLLSLSGLYFYQHYPHKTKLEWLARQFYFDLLYAKEQAILQQELITLCPIDPLHWEKGYQVHRQNNHINNKTDTKTLLLQRNPSYPHYIKIQAHFGLNRPCVYFDKTGQSLFNGHFSYALKQTPADIPDATLILTQTGKIHLSLQDVQHKNT